jgi:2-methylcitrate dehydratase PrpD
VVSAFTTVANGLAGMIAGQSLSTATAVSVAGVTGPAVTTTRATAMATSIATAVTTTSSIATAAAAATTTTTTTTTTTLFRIGGVHDGQVNGEQWRSRKHQGAGHDSKKTLVL